MDVSFEEDTSNANQACKYNGKELDRMHVLDWYDYGARNYDAALPVWTTVDPLAEKYPNCSPYTYCFNNPIRIIDPYGQEPTPAEAVRMATHVYGDKKDDILTGGWRVSNRDSGIQLHDATGLKSLVYERVETELSYVGHSLGGGQAALNYLVTDGDGVGRKAFTFNAAGVGYITKVVEGTWKIPFNSESKIEAYILRTDPLNKLQNSSPIMPDVNGNRNYLRPKDLPSIYNGHSIDNIIKNFGVSNPNEYKKQ